jgi:murein peptide amidase A
MASITAMALTLLVIGHSAEGRPIEVLHVGGPGARVLVVGCIHGNECAALPVVRALARTHAREDLWLVPNLNPDGYARGTRANAHGVDLNRSFPAGREPETRAAVSLIRRLRPRLTIWFHQPQALVRAWGRSIPAARRYARLAGMQFAALRWPPGAATRWQNLQLRETSFVVELPPGKLSAAAISRQVRAVIGAAAGIR